MEKQKCLLRHESYRKYPTHPAPNRARAADIIAFAACSSVSSVDRLVSKTDSRRLAVLGQQWTLHDFIQDGFANVNSRALRWQEYDRTDETLAREKNSIPVSFLSLVFVAHRTKNKGRCQRQEILFQDAEKARRRSSSRDRKDRRDRHRGDREHRHKKEKAEKRRRSRSRSRSRERRRDRHRNYRKRSRSRSRDKQ